MDWQDANLLLMSSGNFDGQDLQALAKEIAGNPLRFQRGDWIKNPQSGL
jgi:UDP-N-acetylmuramate: L-alanyl-gamma-D-glutamyl-meso-diaminopimelate ligase